MIIVVPQANGTLDSLMKRSLMILKRKYPGDSIAIFSKKNLFIDPKKNDLASDNSDTPHRLTFIGHSDFFKYGGYTASEFTDRLISDIYAAIEIYPKFRNAIKMIDLLGCENGLVNNESQSYAQAVTDRLFAAGFIIQVNAFTNLDAAHPFPVYSSIMFHTHRLISNPTQNESAFCFSLLRSSDAHKEYFKLIDIKRALYRRIESKPITQFQDSLMLMKIKWQLDKTNPEECNQDILLLGEEITRNTVYHVFYKTAPTLAIKMMTILITLNLNDVLMAFPLGIPNTPIECAFSILHQLDLINTQLSAEIKKHSMRQAAISEVVTVTNNPRHYFDTNFNCNFIPTQLTTPRISASPLSFQNRHNQLLVQQQSERESKRQAQITRNNP